MLNNCREKEERKTNIEANVTVRWVYDEDPDLSWIGKWTDKWEEGAMERESVGRNEYKYFVPAIKEEEHYKGLVEKGYTKRGARRMARRYNKQDLNRMEGFGDGWFTMGCIVTVSIGGIEAYDSLWGIESNSDEVYLEEVIEDCMNQAKSELIEKLNKLSEVVK